MSVYGNGINIACGICARNISDHILSQINPLRGTCLTHLHFQYGSHVGSPYEAHIKPISVPYSLAMWGVPPHIASEYGTDTGPVQFVFMIDNMKNCLH